MDPLLIDVPMEVVTPRLVVRAPRLGDGAVMCEAVNESLEELRRWLPWAQQAPKVEDSELFLRKALSKFYAREDLVFHLWTHAGDGVATRLVGGVGLHRIDWTVPRFEIGYWRRTGHERQGLITEAVIALNRMAFDRLHAQRVEIRMDEDNAPSRRVAERAGFTFEGLLRQDRRGTDNAPCDTRVYARVRGIEEPLQAAADGISASWTP